MTDNTFFEPPDDEPAQTRKSLLILGAAGGALALAAGGYFLLGGGGGSRDSGTQALALPAPRPAVIQLAPTSAKKAIVIPVVSKVRLGRDPFLALYVPPVVSAPPAAGAGTTATGTTATGPAVSTSPTFVPLPTVSSSSPAPVAPTSTAVPAAKKHTFTIFSITGSAATGRARVSIDGGAPFTVHEGSVFGPTKELTITDIGFTGGVGEHIAYTLGEDPQPEMYAHESRLVP